MKDAAVAAPALVDALFNKEGINPGLATLNFEYTTSTNGERHKYHIIVYQEDSGWHEAIQAALKEEE